MAMDKKKKTADELEPRYKAKLYAKASKGSSPSAGTRLGTKSNRPAAPHGEDHQNYWARQEIKTRFKSDKNTMKILKSGKNKNTNKKYK